MATTRETMAAITLSTPRKASSSRITVRIERNYGGDGDVALAGAISSCSSTGVPVSPTVTPLNSGCF